MVCLAGEFGGRLQGNEVVFRALNSSLVGGGAVRGGVS